MVKPIEEPVYSGRGTCFTPFLAAFFLLPALFLSAGFLASSVSGQGSEDIAALKANLDLPFDAAGDDEEEEEAPAIIVFYSQVYESHGFFFTCDRSSSMNRSNKWPELKRELARLISEFEDRVQFGVIFFDLQVLKYPAGDRPATATPDRKAAALAWIQSKNTGSGSCAKEALIAALKYAKASTVKRKAIIHLADGKLACRTSGLDKPEYSRKTLEEIRQRNTSGVQIHTICIGLPQDVDEDWMITLARQNNGTFRRIVK